jgi:hypothetical protein
VITPCCMCASPSSSSSLESATHGVSTEPPVPSSTHAVGHAVYQRLLPPATLSTGPPRTICSMVGCGGASGLPPIHPISLHSCRRLVSRRSSRCAACTCFRSSFICCVRSHLSRCRRLHPNRCSSDTELPFCLIHLWTLTKQQTPLFACVCALVKRISQQFCSMLSLVLDGAALPTE